MAQDSVVQAADAAPADLAGQTGNAGGGLAFVDYAVLFVERWRLLVLGPLCAGLVALGITYLIAPTFTSRTVFLPPQQQQSLASSALTSLGALSGLAGGAAGLRNIGEQYVSVMQSVTVSDRIIDQFKLMAVYDTEFRVDARKKLEPNVRISLSKRDGMITVEVDDVDPQRAADIANRYVEELRRATATLAMTEAQQRRTFFEQQLQRSRDQLIQSQQALQASGFNPGSLKAEPKAAAEGYARLKAEVTAAEVRLQVMRGSFTDSAPEVRQQQAIMNALREQLTRNEQPTDGSAGPDYIGRYREFKYQETLFELYARQFELARLDESREGALIQVVDIATPAERKTKPKRSVIAIATTLVSAFFMALWISVRGALRQRGGDSPLASALGALGAAARHRPPAPSS